MFLQRNPLIALMRRITALLMSHALYLEVLINYDTRSWHFSVQRKALPSAGLPAMIATLSPEMHRPVAKLVTDNQDSALEVDRWEWTSNRCGCGGMRPRAVPR